MSDATIRAAIVGASGYTGAELMRLLAGHPRIAVTALIAGRSAGRPSDEVFPHIRGLVRSGVLPPVLEAADAEALAARADVVFLALPHGEALSWALALAPRGVTVIDLSADFRLGRAEARAQWYGDNGAEHLPAPLRSRTSEINALRARAVYGLPERHRARLATADLIANPGCFPTAAILSIAPFLAAGLVLPGPIVIDAKSGASGAGRAPAQSTLLAEAGEGVRPYKVGGAHRHTPEIEEQLGLAAAREVRVLFTPHLAPMTRGILSCAYLAPTPGVTTQVAHDVLRAAYEREPFVDVLPMGEVPDTSFMRGSNRAAVAVIYDPRTDRLLAMSAIDNLIKGAAGQAIQCLNIRMGWAETTGLSHGAMFP